MENNNTPDHTPYPWKVRFMGGKDDGENTFFVEAKNNNMPELGYGIEIMGDDFGDHNGYPRKQRLSDAKLIASAPKMLQILKAIDAGARLAKSAGEPLDIELILMNTELAIKEAIHGN